MIIYVKNPGFPRGHKVLKNVTKLKVQSKREFSLQGKKKPRNDAISTLKYFGGLNLFFRTLEETFFSCSGTVSLCGFNVYQ